MGIPQSVEYIRRPNTRVKRTGCPRHLKRLLSLEVLGSKRRDTMTYQGDFTLPAELLKEITEQGLDFIPELIRILVNAAMKAERQNYLRAEPYQHSP
jgi:hypothetical protein